MANHSTCYIITYRSSISPSVKFRNPILPELPVEILIQIFSYTISDFYSHINKQVPSDHACFNHQAHNSNTDTRIIGKRNEQFKPTYLRSAPTHRFSSINSNIQRTSLMSVCQHWNNIVQNTPLLWRTIELVDTIPTQLSILKKRLERAGSILLDVIFEPRNISPQVVLSSLRLILRSYSQQLPVLHIDFSSFYTPLPLSQIDSHIPLTSYFSNLQNFILLDPRSYFYHILQQQRINSTHLHSLSIDDCHILNLFTDASLNSVRYLAIEQTDKIILEDDFTQIARCCNVCVVHWACINYSNLSANVVVSWPSLKALVLMLYQNQDGMHTFRRPLCIPMVEEFMLSSLISSNHSSVSNMLDSLRTPSSSHLIHLTLHRLYLLHPEMASLAIALPQLRTLTFIECQNINQNPAEPFLIPIIDTLPLPCPMLVNVTFSATAVSTLMLLRSISSRRRLTPDSTLEILITCNGECQHGDEIGEDIFELVETFPDIIRHLPHHYIPTPSVAPLFGTTTYSNE